MSADNSSATIAASGDIGGYLYKRTRDGRWQRRFFETNEVYLTYYKTSKKVKVLAALSLASVGDIRLIDGKDIDSNDTTNLAAVSPQDDTGFFSLELNSRLYVLRAANRAEAVLWIGVLQKMKGKGQREREHASISGTEKGPLAGKDGNNPPRAEWNKDSRRCWHYICCCCRRRKR